MQPIASPLARQDAQLLDNARARGYLVSSSNGRPALESAYRALCEERGWPVIITRLYPESGTTELQLLAPRPFSELAGNAICAVLAEHIEPHGRAHMIDAQYLRATVPPRAADTIAATLFRIVLRDLVLGGSS
jgi:hypothetical protein